MQKTRIELALTKVGGQWEAGLLVDGKFRRSYVGPDIMNIATRSLAPILQHVQEEGVDVLFQVGINPPEGEQGEVRGPDTP